MMAKCNCNFTMERKRKAELAGANQKLPETGAER